MTPLLLAALLALQDDDKGFLGLHEAEMVVRNQSGSAQLLISGILDLEHYAFDDEAPGLLFYEDNDYTTNPRATLFFDGTVGDRVYFFAQVRGDRGFDPNYHRGGQARFDEWFGRYTLAEKDWTAALQVGKFATPLGNFVPRHDSMKNPLVRAPLVYDHVTGIGDAAPVAGNQALINRRDTPDLKDKWVTMLWGPVYHTGVLAFVTAGRVDARLAVTNATPSERPSEWDAQQFEPETAAVSARFGWNPFTGFKVGFNAAHGPYLRERIEKFGVDQEDFDQTLLGLDFEYGIGHLVLFAEAYLGEWEVPNVSGDPRAFSYYVEGKYSLFPGFFVAGRWGQMLFSEIDDAGGNATPWDRAHWRAELGAGWFIYVNLLAKAQVEFNHTNGRDPDDHVGSFSLSLSF